jgi:hypothetical protein
LRRSSNVPRTGSPRNVPSEVQVPADAKKIANDPRLEELVRRAPLRQINPDLRYEVHGGDLTLAMSLGSEQINLGSVQIKPGSEDLSLAEFEPPLEGKRDLDDRRLTQYELIRFADQCYKRRNSPKANVD